MTQSDTASGDVESPEANAPDSAIDGAPVPDVHAYRVLTDSDVHLVRVFYATDRAPTGVQGEPRWNWRVFLPTLIAGSVSALLIAGAFRSSRWTLRIVSIVLSLASAGMTITYGHMEIVRLGQLRRATEFGNRTYGNERHTSGSAATLELGTCEVSIPPDHRVGLVESPSILRLEFREDPLKHVVLQRVVRLPDDEFYRKLKASVDESFEKQAFVFVHGYNVGFDDAVKRTAQIAYDLRFDGAAICYSWPSCGELAHYTEDEANVSWTVVQLERFLLEVVQKTQAKSVHLVAHSMGNRALIQALERISLHEPPSAVFGQVVLAAPDVDADEFRNRYAPSLRRVAAHVTLYASSSDRALQASTRVHGYTRAGLSGEHRVVCPEVDTIDVSPIDTSLIGHSYYGDNPLMIRDLEAVVAFSLPAENREWLRRMSEIASFAYWTFRNDLPVEEFFPEEL
jgi:esterase/lipase superfamily enzyme